MVAGTNSRSGRLPRGLLVGAAAVSLVAGCGGNGGSSGQAAAGSSSSTSAASSSASGPKESPLTKGLLSPGAFGSQATVTSMTLQQFRQTTSGTLSRAGDLKVDPPQCADALKSTQPDPNKIKDLVAEAATAHNGSQGAITVEAIATGDLVDGATATLDAAVQNCPEITLTSPQLGQATVEFSRVDVSKVADKAAAVQFTTTITPPGHSAVTVPALIGAVQDGDRLVMLIVAAASSPAAAQSSGAAQPSVAPPDTAAFTSLLQKAYRTEKDALG